MGGLQLSISIWLQWLEVGGSWSPFKIYFRTDMIQRNTRRCAHCFKDDECFFWAQFLFWSPTVHSWISYRMSGVPFSSSLLPVCAASQVWKLPDTWPRELIILDPRPITPHYPLCGPLSGERHATIARHGSRRHHRALMDAPVCPRLLGSPGQQTFKFSDSRCTKGALVQVHRAWPLEVKHQGVSELSWKWH